MKPGRAKGRYKVPEMAFLCLACLAFYAAVFCGQEPRPQQQLSAPPPMKAIAREERTQLEIAKDPKARLRNTLELAEAHLGKAESETSQHNFEAASVELGRYWGLIEDALNFLDPLSHDSNKTRDLYKRLELALRAHGPRLTSMRRTTPLEYGVWLKEIEEFARNARTEALNSFYGHTVVRDVKQNPINLSPSDRRPKEASTPKLDQPQ